jgi:hypothetical protein
MRTLAIVLAALFFAPSAGAQPAPPAAAPAVSWAAAFDEARGRLLAGEFDAARDALDALARTAPSPEQAAVARALTEVARHFAERGYALVLRKDLGDGDLEARAVDRRTGAEIATLYIAATAYGLGTGAWLAVLVEPDSVAGVTMPLLIAGTAAPVSVYLIDTVRPLRYGTPTAVTNGLTLGLLQGGLWTAWYQAQADALDEVSGKTAATLVWLPTTAGAVLGGVLGEHLGTTPGRAELVGAGSLFSAAFGGLVTLSIRPDGREADETALLSAALMANAGAVGGWILGTAWSPSIARVRYMQLGGLGGGVGAGLLYATFAAGRGGSARAFTATSALGLAGGLGLAAYLTRDLPRDTREVHDAASTVSVLLVPGADGAPTLSVGGRF